MKPIVQFSLLKEIVNKEGLRMSRECQGKLDEAVRVSIQKAIKRAKGEKARQLQPEHFDEKKGPAMDINCPDREVAPG